MKYLDECKNESEILVATGSNTSFVICYVTWMMRTKDVVK